MSLDDIESLNGKTINVIEEVQFKPFRETYKIITFTMAVGMIYPKPEVEKLRFLCFIIAFLSVWPISTILLIDVYKSWQEHDFLNIIRHGTVIGPFLAIFTKILIFFYKRKAAKQVIDEMDSDYANYNHLPVSYKTIVNSHVQNNLFYAEKCWTILVHVCVLMFPVAGIVLNLYSFLFTSDPIKYMVHDMNKPFSTPEARLESPYFEFMFVYSCYCSIFYLLSFTGFDAFFGLTINHACLKMDLYCKAFEDALMLDNKTEIQRKLVDVIKLQNKMFEFVDLIQDTFSIWLMLILVISMIQICNLMYYISEGGEIELKYCLFIIGTTAHIYLPCRYSSKLKYMSMETATRMYSGGWENVYDVSIRRIVLIMIMRAQVPLEITVVNLFVFDMDLFVAIMKTSYSMYTLLCS